ncbi:MAG: DUF427 domain-containing protein [Parvibaculum sp.]
MQSRPVEPGRSSAIVYPRGSDTRPSAQNLLIFVEAGGRVRAACDGVSIADSRGALIVRELSHSRVFYFPRGDVRLDLFTAVTQTSHCPRKGDASYFAFGDADGPAIAWSYEDPIAKAEPIRGYIAFYEDQITLEVED